MMPALTGKTALITGAGRGIGRAIALKLASEGARLVLNDLDDGPLAQTVREIVQRGGDATPFPGSVTAPDFGDRFVRAAVSAYGCPDIIVNNAGYTWDNVIRKMSDEQFDAMTDVHLKAPFRILRAVQPYIRDAHDREAAEGKSVMRKVVNISSIAGIGGAVGQSNYASAKSGVRGLTRSLAKEWGPLHVTVNCVAFGYIETRLTEAVDRIKVLDVAGHQVTAGIPKDSVKGFTAMIPIGRAGTADEAAGAIWLFCAPQSDGISGQTLVAGGGLVWTGARPFG